VKSPHTKDPTSQRDNGSGSPQARFLHLLEKGEGIPEIVGVFLHKSAFPHLFEKQTGISYLDGQIMKVPRSERVNGEEFLVDISKSKMKSSYALIWK